MKQMLPWTGFMAAAMLALATGCRTVPAPPAVPPAPPPVITDMYYFPGTPLSGPMTLPDDHGDPWNALKIEIFLAAMENLPEEPLEFLEAHARLVASSRGQKPIRPTGILTMGSRLAFPKDAVAFITRIKAGGLGASAQVSSLTGVLPEGVTAVFRARGIDLEQHPLHGELLSKRFEIRFHRSSEGSEGERLDLALVLEDFVPPGEKEETFGDWEDERFAEKAEPARDARIEAPVLYREIVVLDPMVFDEGAGLALFFPSPFAGPARILAAVIRVMPPPEGNSMESAAHAEAFARCLDLLDHPFAGAEDRGAAVLDEKLPWMSMDEVAASLSDNSRPRAALVYLAGATGARFAEDLGLSAPDELVSDLAEAVLEALRRNPDHGGDELGWILEKTALGRMVEYIEREEITPELAGALSAYAGEISRHASILEEILASSHGLTELDSILVKANAYFLEDTSPASRVRAYDWLAFRNEAPLGYDPLSPLKDRLEALAGYFDEDAGAGGEEEPP